MAADLLVMLDGLRATRDADSCLRGLNLFRKGLRAEEGPAFLARCLRQSPDWQELQAVWDTQLTVQHYHVTVTLLLALADALGVATAAALQPSGGEQEQQAAVLAAGAASLAGAVLHRRLKALYFNLSSDMRGKANAALALLTAVAAACSRGGGGSGAAAASLRDLVRSFDWSLSALPGLVRPPREKKGESAAEHRQCYWQQWALGDALKRPTRAAFCQLALTLLRGAGADRRAADAAAAAAAPAAGRPAEPPGCRPSGTAAGGERAVEGGQEEVAWRNLPAGSLDRHLLGAAAAAAGADTGVHQQLQQPLSSLLAPCALRQLLRVLPSPKIAAGDKAAMAAYVASVLCQLAQQQLGAGTAAGLAEVLLGVVRQVTARRQQGPQQQAADGSADKQSKKDKKRKQAGGADGGAAAYGNGATVPLLLLPPEGRPLLALLAVLEQQQEGGQLAGGEQAQKKRKQSKHAADAAGGGQGAAPVSAPASAMVQANGSMAGDAEAVAAAEAGAAAVGACCQLISQLAASSGGSAELLAGIQQHLAGSSGSGSGAGTCSAVMRQCLHLLEAGGSRCGAAQLGLLQVLQAAVLAGGGGRQEQRREQRRCLQLLAESSLVARALGGGGDTDIKVQQALASTVVQLLRHIQPAAGGSSASSTAVCLPLLEHVASAFSHQLHDSRQAADQTDDSSSSPPAAIQRLLLLLPGMPATALDDAASTLLAELSPAEQSQPIGSSSKKKKKKSASQEPGDGQAAQPPWLGAAAAAVLQHQLSSGSWDQQQGQLEAACGTLLHLACAPAASTAGSDVVGAAMSCLLQLLKSRSQQAAALAALGGSGQAQLLRTCLGQAAAGGSGNLEACSQLAAQLVQVSSDCRQLAAAEVLPGLLSGGSTAALALALPAVAVCLQQQQQQQQGEDGGCAPAGPAETALLAALSEQLLAFFAPDGSSSGGGQQKEKKKKTRKGEAADGDAAAAATKLVLEQHALPCLRLVLQQRPPAAPQRQALLQALLPSQGLAVTPAAGPGSPAALPGPGTAEKAEAAALLLTAGGAASVQELSACVRCFAATLAALLKLPAGSSDLESRLLQLLDGPVGDAVAALPAAQRSCAAFAELASAVAGTLGTAVLRHRLAAAAGSGSEAAQGAEAAGVAALRVLRRFLAALLPDDEEEGGAADGESDSSSEDGSDSEGDVEMRDGPQRQQRQGAVGNPEAASAALQLLQRLLGHSRFLPAMRATAACPPPLPPPALALPRPLASLLPLAAAADDAVALEGVPAAAEVKKELCELLETLLDLHQQYSGGTAGSRTVPQQQRQQEQELVEGAEAALLPLLMAGYGASCSPADAAAWSLAAAINRRQWERRGGQEGGEAEAAAAAAAADGDGDMAALAALLHGPLGSTGFAWGPAAAALQQLPAPAAGAGEQQQQQRRRERAQLLQQRLPLDPARAALTVCHWPEGCSLAVPGSSGDGDGTGSDAGGAPEQLPAAAAAYDPGFLLPFCCACLRQQLLPPRAFAEAGLLSVCLRGLAAADPGCRAASYQALALFEAQLTGAAAPDFREMQQLSVLLGALRAAVTRPFQRLPAVHAVFLAEAALLALHPGAAMYPAVNKHLTRRALLSITDVPLLGQLLLSGGQQHAADRRWMLQLLVAGLRTADDAGLYRRQHAFELAMSLHDSCVADPAASTLALRLVCTATFIPRAARQLAQESGLIPWLAAAAGSALQCLLSPDDQQRRAGGGSLAAVGDEALAAPLQALRRLLQLRTVMRGSGGAAAARQMVAAAHQLAAAALAAVGGPGAVPAAASVCRQLLPLLLEVRQLGAGSHAQARHLQNGSGSLAALATAVEALQQAAGLSA